MKQAIEYLEEKFPKGDKRRGEAMCLLAIALAEQKKEICKLIKSLELTDFATNKKSNRLNVKELLNKIKEK